MARVRPLAQHSPRMTREPLIVSDAPSGMANGTEQAQFAVTFHILKANMVNFTYPLQPQTLLLLSKTSQQLTWSRQSLRRRAHALPAAT
jgi:hypothetical protein